MVACLPVLNRYAGKLLRSRAGVDDLVQATALRALEKRSLFAPGNLRSWLFTIMHNCLINQRRKDRHQPTAVAGNLDITDPAQVWSVASTDDTASNVIVAELRDALGRLSPAQRRLVIGIGVDGRGYEDVAESEGIPTGTVRSRLSRGREELRVMIDRPRVEA